MPVAAGCGLPAVAAVPALLLAVVAAAVPVPVPAPAALVAPAAAARSVGGRTALGGESVCVAAVDLTREAHDVGLAAGVWEGRSAEAAGVGLGCAPGSAAFSAVWVLGPSWAPALGLTLASAGAAA